MWLQMNPRSLTQVQVPVPSFSPWCDTIVPLLTDIWPWEGYGEEVYKPIFFFGTLSGEENDLVTI
jgi:hypothetical protein